MASKAEETAVTIRLILICTLLSLAALCVMVEGHPPASMTARAPLTTAG